MSKKYASLNFISVILKTDDNDRWIYLQKYMDHNSRYCIVAYIKTLIVTLFNKTCLVSEVIWRQNKSKYDHNE